MGEILPTDDEGLKTWCIHQISHVPAVAGKLALSSAEVSVYIENCKAIVDALEGRLRGALRGRRGNKNIVPRVKKTSLRRQIQTAKVRGGYDRSMGLMLGWG
jgi:hypothetical protein